MVRDAHVSENHLEPLWTTRIGEQPKVLHFDQILPLTQTSIPGIFLPTFIWERLFNYQRRGLDWLLGLWVKSRQLRNKDAGDTSIEAGGYGGILADEMGLGKTVQIISLLAALHCSKKLRKQVLIICPATVIQQWRTELHRWWPCLRVCIFSSHSTPEKRSKRNERWSNEVQYHAHVLLSTYGQLMTPLGAKILLRTSLSVAVLDEGHLIRNVNAGISKRVRQIKAPLRLILSGTPMQNNLTELWSLVDFCVPGGLLGPLALFKTELADPIAAGGWVNASSLQIATSRQCAAVLRDLVRPVMLRRTLADVRDEMMDEEEPNIESDDQTIPRFSIPKKSEQIVYCQPSNQQRELHERLMQTEEMIQIVEERRNILWGIDQMTKLCNHPLLVNAVNLEGGPSGKSTDWVSMSGKLAVTRRFMREWMAGDHWVLVFCQTRQMLGLIEKMLQEEQISYLRMDGTTGSAERANLIDKFNQSRVSPTSSNVGLEIDPLVPQVMLLTTKVGGIGINLTAADRVLIYEPDWNPATDHQARSRAHRLGQTRPVLIFRLLTAGSIEERVFERQVYKIWLGGRILLKGGLAGYGESTDTDGSSSSSRNVASVYDLFNLDDGMSGKAADKGHQITTPVTQLKPANSSSSDVNILKDLLKVAHVPEDDESDTGSTRSKESSASLAIIKRDAQKMAQNALKVLKSSLRYSTGVDVPWNKKESNSGMSGSGVSGNDILQAIYARQALANNRIQKGTETSDNVGERGQNLSRKHAAMLDKLLTILSKPSGSANTGSPKPEENADAPVYLTTQQVIDGMSDDTRGGRSLVEDEVDRAVFRQMLRTIANQVKDGKTVYWHLKPGILK